ncbi:MAG: AI-2E family transporter, partial [Phycisphaerae bacterium]|nr:AI-2E family transporter [Saprospiraceae bacterium]
ISSQLADFSETLPLFKEKFGILIKQSYEWFSDTFNVKTKKIYAWVEQAKAQSMGNSTALIGTTLSTVGSLLAVVFLVPVYIFMFLFYKPLLLDFIGRLFERQKHGTVVEVLMETKILIQRYLSGLMLELVLIATVNSTALLLIGVEYAVLLGIIGAMLNIIPYIGGIVAISLPTLVALATQSPEAAGWVVLAYVIIQLIDNNFVVPMIVASKVKINALVSIVVVLIGGAVWGIPGMFLSIPLTAIVKVIFDRIEPLQPWGFLLGDTMPPIGKTVFYFRKERKKPKSTNSDEP